MSIKKKIKKLEKALAKNKKVTFDYFKEKKRKINTPKLIKPGFTIAELEKIKAMANNRASANNKADSNVKNSSTSSNDGKLVGSVEIYTSDKEPGYKVKTYGSMERFALEFVRSDVMVGYGSCEEDEPFHVIKDSGLIFDSLFDDLDVINHDEEIQKSIDGSVSELDDENVIDHVSNFNPESDIVLPAPSKTEVVYDMNNNNGFTVVFDKNTKDDSNIDSETIETVDVKDDNEVKKDV